MGPIGLEGTGNSRKRHEVRLWGAWGSHHEGLSWLPEGL